MPPQPKDGDIVRWPNGIKGIAKDFSDRWGAGPFILRKHPSMENEFYLETITGEVVKRTPEDLWHTSAKLMKLDLFLMAVRARRHAAKV